MLKAGFPAWGLTGDPNATVDRAEPLVFGAQFGAHGPVPADLSVALTNGACDPDGLGLRRRAFPVHHCREIGLPDMVAQLNESARPWSTPRGEHVTFDGEQLRAEPIESVSLSRLYFL